VKPSPRVSKPKSVGWKARWCVRNWSRMGLSEYIIPKYI